ncbi:MAG: LPS export ABC transporter periplasmic protein LptC [Sphingobacteriales bacterium UTBCD1]|jgi:LPS export ABC transporter protein LptC|nr:MAG: LPS export ABC transporter periplasmic protein LptC [Sphingobacteriales bacterium UTBCD1]
MINKKIYLVKIFFTAAIITGCFLFISCENDTKKIRDWTENKTMSEEARSIVSYLSDHGVMKAKLTASYMLRVLTDTVYLEFPHSLHIDFFDSTGKIDTRMDAEYGKYFESLNKAYLRGNVVVINIKGDTLLTPELWWDQNTAMFFTDSVAQYHTSDKHITGGKGLRATQDLKSIIFKYPTGPVLVTDSLYQQ